MTPQAHPAVVAVHAAASTVVNHEHEASPSGSFWHRWFDAPGERHLADEVRSFVAALDLLLDVPPTMLTRADLTMVGDECDRVIKRVEAAINEPDAYGRDTGASLASAAYVIRARHEELYRRGATKEG